MKLYNNEQVVISLTSWTKRIDNVHKTIQSLLQWCGYCHIVLVLSTDEFPRQEKELPQELIKLIEGDFIELLWVKRNCKAYKKYFFTAAKYPEAIVVTADDDSIYTSDFVGELYSHWKKNKNGIVTFRSTIPSMKREYKTTCLQYGVATLYPPNYYDDVGLKLITDETIFNQIAENSFDDNFHSALRVVLNKTDYTIIDKCHKSVWHPHDEVNAVTARRDLTKMDPNSDEFKQIMAEIDEQNFRKTETLENIIRENIERV